MKMAIFLLLVFSNFSIYAQEIDSNIYDEEYYDFGTASGIIIYGERPTEFDSGSIEAFVLNQLNGSLSERKTFIETEFLEDAGFRRTGNVRYRKTDASERALSVLHGVGNILSFGFVPKKPFFEMEYERLPKGKFYSFESIFIASRFNNVPLDVRTIMKLEYMLQIEFFNGTIVQDNINYYTNENINNFEELILKLSDYPESIKQSKDRFFRELTKIKAAFERHNNPSENQLRAIENLRGSFNN